MASLLVATSIVGTLATAGPLTSANAQTAPPVDEPAANSPADSTNDSAAWSPTECGTYSGSGCFPARDRVDLVKPTFSNPTKITNPLNPIARLRSVVLLGRADGEGFRSETTLLPRTRVVHWDGKAIETLVSQYVAYRSGRIEEVAYDFYAQADDGSVWYFGEDVVDYVDGHVTTTDGTWLAGRDGPPAMIMPANPKVGDVYRSENVLGVVFEEIRVRAVNHVVQGPHGPVRGAMIGTELHLDESTEEKIFAPGYGEFSTGSGDNREALAIAVDVNRLDTKLPRQLMSLLTSAGGMLGAVRAEDWEAADSITKRMNREWNSLSRAKQPPLIAAQLTSSLKALTDAVKARQPAFAVQLAIDVGQSVADLELQYRTRAQVDHDRFTLWAQQVLVYAAAEDPGGLNGAVATLEWIRDRIVHTLQPAGVEELDRRLAALRVAADAEQLSAAGDHAARLIGRLRFLRAVA